MTKWRTRQEIAEELASAALDICIQHGDSEQGDNAEHTFDALVRTFLDVLRDRFNVTGKRHGMSKSPIYSIWEGMMQRCNNPRGDRYSDYGGRGIEVCERWTDFPSFHNDLFPSWKFGLTLERIDNNGNYELNNCCWSSRKNQSNNTRRNKFLEYSGQRLTISQWADLRGIEPWTLTARVRRKWPVAQALGIEPRQRPIRKLNPSDAPDIRRRSISGERQLDIAKYYGVHPALISKILSGRTWASTEDSK